MTDQTKAKGTTAKKGKRSFAQILWTITQLTLLLFFIGAFFAGGAAAGYIASLVREDPVRSFSEISESVFTNHLTGFAYFNDGTLIGQLRAEEDRRLIKKEDVSPHLINAIIATEDKNFYEHRGIDPKGLIRATLQDIMGSPIQTGGSTLTQQLIKQTILTPEVSHKRKAREIFLALRIERMFSKDQILEAYMNEMYFGRSAHKTNIYGVQAAAKGIFGVDAKDLNIPQAAYIAGMLQAPSRYIPFEDEGLKRGLERQKLVLRRMLENAYITKEQYNEALAYDIQSHLYVPEEKSAYSQYPFLMMEIEERAARALADKEIANDPNLDKKTMSREAYRNLVDEKRNQILRGGYHIYTTIDKKIYEMMNSIAKNPDNFGPNRTYKDAKGRQIENALEEVGATLIDNKTGAILGFIGGRNFDVQQVNHTTRPRQPGSAMKPLAAYAPAFEKGFLQPGSVIDDVPIALENGTGNPPHYPNNWNFKFHGLITAREALRQSYNIPAIKTYLHPQLGIPEALSYVEKMGVTTLVTPEDNKKYNDYQAKTGVIGGLTQGLTVEEITNAYSTFPNQGTFLDAYMIEKIENNDKEKIYEHTISPETVFSEQTAYLMTDMMKTVVTSGTASSLTKMVDRRRDIAGKTGTTNDDHDSWFVGYIPEVTLGVWIGYDIPYRLPRQVPPRPIIIWSKVMNGLFEIYPERYPVNSKFTKPSGIVSRAICSKSGKLPTELCHEAGTVITEVFNQKFVPTETCDVHQKGRIIQYNDQFYLAKDETPDDMVIQKVALKSPEPLIIPENTTKPAASYRPLDWESRLPDEADPRTDDGNNPSKPQVSLNSKQLTWNANPEEDVVGYRIYKSVMGSPFMKIGVVFQPAEKTFTLPEPGSYYVTAVDVAGRESEPSDTVEYGQPPTPPSEENGNILLPHPEQGEQAPSQDQRPQPSPDPLDGILPPDPAGNTETPTNSTTIPILPPEPSN